MEGINGFHILEDLPSFAKVHCTQTEWAHHDTRSGGKHAVSAEARLGRRGSGERHRRGVGSTHFFKLFLNKPDLVVYD